jgi:copper transport protein
LGAGRSVTVDVDPDVHGTVTVGVSLSKGAAPESISGTAFLASKDIGPIPLGLSKQDGGVYGASGLALPAAGRWTFHLIVTMSEFDATDVDVTIHLY